MTIKIKYYNGDYEEFTCDKMECDGTVFVFKTAGQDDIIVPYAGIECIDY